MGKKADQTRKRIDDAALALFAEKGVDQTTINDIARGAGIAEGTIYRHYASKDELIWGLFSKNYAILAERLELLQKRERGLHAKLRAMVLAFCNLFESDRALFSFLLLVQHGQLPRVPADMASPVRVVRDVLETAIRRGEIPEQDPELATAIVFGIVLQPAVFKVYGRVEQPMTELAERLADAAWHALLPKQGKRGGAAP